MAPSQQRGEMRNKKRTVFPEEYRPFAIYTFYAPS